MRPASYRAGAAAWASCAAGCSIMGFERGGCAARRGAAVPVESQLSVDGLLSFLPYSPFALLTSISLAIDTARAMVSADVATAMGGAACEAPECALLCPICHCPMIDPVILSGSGHTYERLNIVSWFEGGKSTDPVTNLGGL